MSTSFKIRFWNCYLINFGQHFVVDLEDTGESQLTIFSDAITSLSIGDEIGIFDIEGITNSGDCSNCSQ